MSAVTVGANSKRLLNSSCCCLSIAARLLASALAWVLQRPPHDNGQLAPTHHLRVQ
jgi:hypothetical protein